MGFINQRDLKNKNSPSEHLFLEREAGRRSLWSDCGGSFVEEEVDGAVTLSLSLVMGPLELDRDDLSNCLSRASVIRFRSRGPISGFDPRPTRSRYMSPLQLNLNPLPVCRIEFNWLSQTRSTNGTERNPNSKRSPRFPERERGYG